jgi:hypothetical protein
MISTIRTGLSYGPGIDDTSDMARTALRKTLLGHLGSTAEPVGRQEVWMVLLTVGAVLIAFLVSEVAGRMGAEEADSTAPWAQFA